MTETFTLAHFSDIHLDPHPGLHPRYWNLKRALGWINWHKGRKHIHKKEIADRLISDALSLRADHIAITGDLATLGLPLEFERAHSWLQSITTPSRMTVIPGNHDIYSKIHDDIGVARWAPYMGGEAETHAFPFVRRVGPLALIGLNSAEETPPFVAAGRLGAQQIDVAGELLQRLGDDGAVRVVLIHHPPLPGLASERRGLRDVAHFARTLEKHGAELVLYGHNHKARLDWINSSTGPVPIIGAPSSSAAKIHKEEPLARYSLFTFFKTDDRVRIRHAIRGLETVDGPVVRFSETVLEAPDFKRK